MFDSARITEEELMAYRAELRGDLFRQIHRKLKELKSMGFTQAKMASRLGMQPSQLSRILQGKTDIRLETLADLARSLGCRVQSSLTPLQSQQPADNLQLASTPASSNTATPPVRRYWEHRDEITINGP
jgi:transcriptional regulator with XRE-family HTH domain